MKKRYLSFFAALGLAAMSLYGCSAAPIPDQITVRQIDAADNLITVTGQESVKVVPDRAAIRYAIDSRADTAAACQEQNAKDLEAAIEVLKSLGIEETSIQTSSYGMDPVRNWDSGRQEIIAYEMSTSLTISDLAIDQVGSVLSQSVAAGVNNIHSVQYFSSTYDASYQEALQGAIAMAWKKAEALAAASGSSIGEVANIQESGYYPESRYSTYNSARTSGAVMEDAGADMAVMPGQITVEAQVIVSYRLK